MADSWLPRFEERLEILERRMERPDATFVGIASAARDAIASLADVSGLEFWLVRNNVPEKLLSDGERTLLSGEDFRNLSAAESRFLAEHPPTAQESAGGEIFVSCSIVAHDIVSTLAVQVVRVHAPRNSFADGVATVLSVVDGFISRQLLSQYEVRLQQQTTLLGTVAGLHQSQTFAEAASAVVQDGGALMTSCRLGVAVQTESIPRIIALTGVRDPRPEAETVRAIADVVSDASTGAKWIGKAEWVQLDHSEETKEAVETLRNGGVKAVRCLPLIDEQNTTSRGDGDRLWLTIESFDADALPDESLIQQLAVASAPVLQDRYRRESSWFRRLVHRRYQRRAVVAAILLAVLILFPVRFEVEVPGQLMSTDRRRIFAPDDGTIDRVLFQNEAAVADGQTLLVMSNSDLDLTQRQLEGRISTGVTELASIESQRLVADDPELSRKQKQLSEEISNLRAQLDVVTEQSKQLIVDAPFAGRVFRSNAEQELLSRPVQRGQLLLELVPEDGGWQLELKIPDRLRAYVTEHRELSDEPSRIRYLIMSSPERDWPTELSTVENALQIEHGQLVCRATAELADVPQLDLKPGTSVTARIHCGSRSLGFVMFREVIEFWWWLKFAWL